MISSVVSFFKKYFKLSYFLIYLFCLLFAFGIWIYAVQANYSNYELTFPTIPVTLLNIDTLESEHGLSIVSGDSTSISVTVTGTKDEVSSLSASDITATVDVSSITSEGITNLPIAVKVTSRGNVTVKNTSKNSVSVYTDRVCTVTLPIQTQVVNASHPSNYVIIDPIPAMTTVQVTGPQTTISTISYVLAKVNFDNQIVTTSMTSVCPLTLISKTGTVVNNPHISMEFTDVEVSVPVYEQKEVPIVYDFEYGFFAPDDYTITLSPETVIIQGEPEKIEAVNTLTIGSINEKEILNQYNATRTISVPPEFSLVNSDGKVEISISLSQEFTSNTRTFTIDHFQVIGASKEFKITSEPLLLKVRGIGESASRIDFLTLSDFDMILDLSEYDEEFSGTVRVPVKVSFKAPFTSMFYEIGFYTVEVEF